MSTAVDTALAEARGVSFGYGTTPVLEDVDLRVGPGEYVALVGPNGSGKSTLLRLLLGLLEPSAGEVRLFGEPPDRFRDRRRLGYVPQRPVATRELPATVAEVVATGRLAARGWGMRFGKDDRAAVDEAIAAVDLEHERARLIGTLSGGEQQRAFIARALVTRPDLLVLDEPIAGVDAASQRRFRETLRALVSDRGTAVLLVSHELGAVAEDLERIVVLKRSVVFDGTPAELIESGVSLGVHREDLPLWLEGLR
ncbi:MAG: metal ABC transporter ATP-binding protein [Actinobacteria bacterium]|nr:metal ABC transporter ATP-binding protein [Actinomycetota bacterium]